MKIMLIFLLSLLFFACVSEEKGVFTEKKQEPVRSFTLTIKIPGTSVPVTYSLANDDENAIQTIDILAFKVTPEGEYFQEYIPVDGIVTIGSTSNVKQISVTLKDFDAKLVVLANVRNLFTNDMKSLLNDAAEQGTITKKELCKHFVFDFSKPWNTGQINGPIRPFPMFGESNVISKTATTVDDVKMKRSLCRIDIGIDIMDTSVNGFAHDFKIDSVFVFNAKNKGYVAPLFDPAGNILEEPNVPSGATSNSGSFNYKYETTNSKGLRLMERSIYVTEDNQLSSRPTILVVKARYKDDKAQYFRINLKNSNGQLLPFIRNYRYRINITGVASTGYSSAAAAAASSFVLPSDVDANELELPITEFNDYYMLGLGDDKVEFNSDGSWSGMSKGDSFYALNVYTTYSEWSVTWGNNTIPEWLHWLDENDQIVTGKETQFPPSVTSLKIKADPNSASEKSRSATLVVRAGALKRDITITQKTGVAN